MEQPSTKDKIILITAAVGLLGWLLFKNKLRAKVKDWTAASVSKELGVSQELSRSAADMIIG